MTGIWVLGHECGHGSFSKHKILNDILGFFLHASVLMPYFSWQYSHHIHHSKTNHLNLDESHVPATETEVKGKLYRTLKEIFGVETFAIFSILNMLIIDWPLYLLTGIGGGRKRGFTSHFLIPNGLFPLSSFFKVALSNLGIFGVVYLLYLWVKATSLLEVFAIYIAPYIIVNGVITIVLYLHHNDEDIPHLDENAWDWFKGCLCTVDRNYPAFIDALSYYVATTHVVHHLFTDLPHYNAKEANVYVKQMLGDLYIVDKKPILQALWDSSKLAIVRNSGNGIWKYI